MPEDSKRRLSFLDRLTDRIPMGPRKKSKPNPKAPAADAADAANQSEAPPNNPEAPAADAPSQQSSPPAAHPPARRKQGEADASKPAKSATLPKGSWSWMAKAAPTAEVARESISSAAGGVTSDSSSDVSKQDNGPNTAVKFLDRRATSKSSAIAASTTKAVATSNHANTSEEANGESKEAEVAPAPLPPQPPVPEDDKPDVAPDAKGDTTAEQKEARTAASYITSLPSSIASVPRGLYGWWSRPDGYAGDGKGDKGADQGIAQDIDHAKQTPLPGETPVEEAPNPQEDRGQSEETLTEPTPDQSSQKLAPTAGPDNEKGTQRQSWFWLWSSAQNAQQTAKAMEETPQEPDAAAPSGEEQQNPEQEGPQEPAPEENTPQLQAPPQKSAGWAFWSRAKDDVTSDTGSTHKQIGELAVADTPSQSHPEAAQFNEREQPEEQPKETLKSSRGSIRLLRGKGRGTDSRPSTPATPATPVKATPEHSPTRKPAEGSPAKEAAKDAVKDASKTKQPPKQQANPNLLLPEFKNTYQLSQQPSYWGKVRKYVLGGHEPESPHLQRAKDPSRIKKALAIGVHGYFPAAILQKVLGQPTGTSIRFANAAAEAIKAWTEGQGYSCETEKIALEGEGFISDRVDTLWKLLFNWIDHIKTADFILVACHSQGVPVAIMLVAKLIQFGCVNAAKIGVCAMAGVNLGPFPEYRSRFFGGSAAELFEFSSPGSLVSQKYQGALRVVLSYGVKIVYVGSIDDQLVSLESSTFSNITHPYIYRAVFVDGRIHAPDFITHLVGFALKLRNLGLPDHGLVRELSPALAGSLYTGEGHSRIYDDPAVYALAVQHALETTSLPGAQNPSLQIKNYEGASSIGGNPYYLPWAMRGLLEEDFVRKELNAEVEELLALFEGWKPTTKALKDIKFRLEVVRSKL